MQRLVALDLAGGPAFVDAVRRCWDDGDAVAPIDQRLPAAAKTELLTRLRPHELISAGDRIVVEAAAPPVEAGDALVVTSSGSTGVPKVLVHTRTSLEAHARAVHERLEVDADRDRWLACLPLHHLGGFGVVARSVLTGVGVDAVDGFDATVVAAAPDRFATTLVSLVPTALDRLDGSAFRWVVLGGSGDPVARPANVVHTYGLTESGGGVVYDGLALGGVEVRVGGDGQIFLRSATIARGRRAPDGTVRTLVDADGWLATGDLGRWDGDRLVVDGRADDLIVTGGENVWPQAVEQALRRHRAVADVAVHGEPDPAWGQRVVAVVVPVDASAPPSLEELRAHVKATLPPSCAPQAVTYASELPRTALGKLRRSG